MKRCKPSRGRDLPERWLFTDERMQGELWSALEGLPRGSGIVFRHYRSPERADLAERIAGIARRRRLILVIGADEKLARRVGAAGVHLPSWGPVRPALTAAAHGHGGLVRAARAGAALAFVSPVFRTRSHGGRAPLGPIGFGLLSREARLRVAALGGMDASRFRSLRPRASAWGAIDALTPSALQCGTSRS